MPVGVSIVTITFQKHRLWLINPKVPVEGTIATSRVETQLVTQVGGSNQAILVGKITATAAGAPAAMLAVVTRTGDLGPTMDHRAMPTTAKVGIHKARIAIVRKEEIRTMGKAGASRAQIATVLSGEMRTTAQAGINKAQPTIALTAGTTGADLQDLGQRLTTPTLRATPVADGVRVAMKRATATISTTTVFQATCLALGITMRTLNLDSIADPTSLPKAGIILVLATLPMPEATAVMVGVDLLHLLGRHFPARVVTKAGEERATKVGVHQEIGIREVEAQVVEAQVDGTISRQTTLDRPTIRGRRTSPVIPKVRQSIGSGSPGVGLGIFPVIGMVTGAD